jgi:hypothetical protein
MVTLNGVLNEGPWWLVIDLRLPYDTEISQDGHQIRIPFATSESAQHAAAQLTVSVEHHPPVIPGTVIEQAELP